MSTYTGHTPEVKINRHYNVADGATLEEALRRASDEVMKTPGRVRPEISISHAYGPPHGVGEARWTVIIVAYSEVEVFE